jgi:hypothetical protein
MLFQTLLKCTCLQVTHTALWIWSRTFFCLIAGTTSPKHTKTQRVNAIQTSTSWSMKRTMWILDSQSTTKMKSKQPMTCFSLCISDPYTNKKWEDSTRHVKNLLAFEGWRLKMILVKIVWLSLKKRALSKLSMRNADPSAVETTRMIKTTCSTLRWVSACRETMCRITPAATPLETIEHTAMLYHLQNPRSLTTTRK